MSELRRDPAVGYWTIVATERSRRPVAFHPAEIREERACPFCEGKESQTTPEVFAIREPGSTPNGPGWRVRVISSSHPILNPGSTPRHYGQGLYDLMDGVGQHEIIVESPKHNHDLEALTPKGLADVLRGYLHRFREIEKDNRFQYVLLFKNHGLITGSMRDLIRHSRSQLVAMPIIPKRVQEELWVTQSYFERKDRCVFCDMLKQEIADGSRSVLENGSFYAFCPFASRSPFEIWIIPKRHGADFARTPEEDVSDLAQILKQCLQKMAVLLNDPPYNFFVRTAPLRRQQRQGRWRTLEEDYHWHLHISPRLVKSAGLEWGTGIHINPTPPEEAALLLRETPVSEDRGQKTEDR